MFGALLLLIALVAFLRRTRDDRQRPASELSSDQALAMLASALAAKRENLAASRALGKTVVFLLLAPLGAIFGFLPMLWPSFGSWSRPTQDAVQLATAAAFEAILLALVVSRRGPSIAQPFNERQLAAGATVLSLAAWIIAGHTLAGGVFRIVVSGAVLLAVFVYFVAKSVVSRSVRLAVLLTGVLPAIELAYELKALPPPVLRLCEVVVGP